MLRAVVCKYFWFDMENTSYIRCLNKWLRRIPDHKCMSNNIIGANKMNECIIILCRPLSCANDGILTRLCKQVENIVFNNNKIAPKIFIFFVRSFHLNINHLNMHLFQWIFWRKDPHHLRLCVDTNWFVHNVQLNQSLNSPHTRVSIITFCRTNCIWLGSIFDFNQLPSICVETNMFTLWLHRRYPFDGAYPYAFIYYCDSKDRLGMKKGFVFTKHHINACSKFSWTKVLCHLKILSSAHEPPKKSSGMGN